MLTQNIEGFTDFRNRIRKSFNMFEKLMKNLSKKVILKKQVINYIK